MVESAGGFVWVLIGLLGVGVYALRLSFIHLHDVVERFPPRIERGIGFIPAAILAALVTPAVVAVDGSLAAAVLDLRVLAAAVALGTAWRTGSMIATIAVGMGILWAGTFLL